MAKRENLNRDVKLGMAWNVVERGGVQFFNFLASVILARLLSPSDFGVLGLSVLFTGVSGRVASLSFGMAIIQRDDVREDHVATLFVSQLILNSAVFLTLLFISPFAGTYFDNPLVGQVLAVSSFNFLIRIIGGCPSALLRRGRGFRVLSLSNVLDAFVDLCVAAPLGFFGFGVWSLVYGGLAGALVSNLYLVAASGWRPSFRASREAFRELFMFGMGVSVADFITYVSDRTANFVIGKWLGTAALGYFDKGYSLMSRPLRDLSNRTNRVLFPVFARIRHEPGRFRAAVRRTILALSLVGYPVFCSLIVLAPQIIIVLFGSQWEPAVVPFQILCVTGLPRMILQLMIATTFVTGSSRHEVSRRTWIAVLTLVGSFVGLRWGLAGVASSLAIVNLIGLASAVWQVHRLGFLRPVADVLKPQTIPIGGTVAMIAVERACQLWTQSIGMPAFVVLGASLAAGSAAYLVVIAVLKDDVLTRLLAEVRGDLAPLAARVPVLAPITRRLL